MIPFNVPPFLGTETKYIVEAINNQKICGDGPFTTEVPRVARKQDRYS